MVMKQRLGAHGRGNARVPGSRLQADTRALKRRARLSRRVLLPVDEGDALAEALGDLRAAIRALPRGEEALVAVDADLTDIAADDLAALAASQAGDRLDAILETIKAVAGLETDTATLVDPLRKIAALFGVALG